MTGLTPQTDEMGTIYTEYHFLCRETNILHKLVKPISWHYTSCGFTFTLAVTLWGYSTHQMAAPMHSTIRQVAVGDPISGYSTPGSSNQLGNHSIATSFINLLKATRSTSIGSMLVRLSRPSKVRGGSVLRHFSFLLSKCPPRLLLERLAMALLGSLPVRST